MTSFSFILHVGESLGRTSNGKVKKMGWAGIRRRNGGNEGVDQIAGRIYIKGWPLYDISICIYPPGAFWDVGGVLAIKDLR